MHVEESLEGLPGPHEAVKPFKVEIIRYVERVSDIHDLPKYLHPSSMKG